MSNEGFLKAFAHKAEAAGVPLSATIELTERCNLHCVHCLIGDQESAQRRRPRELTTAEWTDVLDQLAALGTLRLLITGGEPLLRRDFAEIYTHAKRLGFLVTVFTNGILVTPAVVELFRDLPPSAVEVTLYGATAATYEAITGVAGSFARCVEGVERLRGLGIDLGLKTVVMTANRHELHDIAELARSWGTLKFRFDTEIQAAFGGDCRPLAVRLEPEDAVRAELSVAETAQSWRDFFQRRADLVPSSSDRLYGCGAGRTAISVNPYGQLQPCLAVRHIARDLRGATLAAALAALRADLDERRAPASLRCTSCDDRVFCSACPAFAFQEHGSEERVPEFQCRSTRMRRQLVATVEAATKEA